MTERILRRPKVEDRTGRSRSSIYAGMAEGSFPQPVKLGTRAVGWRESDIDAWIASRQPRSVSVEDTSGRERFNVRSS